MKLSLLLSTWGLALMVAGCGPTGEERSGEGEGGSDIDGGRVIDGGGGGGGGGECVPTATTESNCFDGNDNDCDGDFDCRDSDCTSECGGGGGGDGADAGDCGEAAFGGDPLAIPDGEGGSYETSLNISGFGDGATLTDLSGFLGACVNMEHTWLRDLSIELICPSGQVVLLQEFLGQTGTELYMGVPDDTDNIDPVPGVGWDYCWRPTATNPPMLEWANQNLVLLGGTLPAGDYQAAGGWNPLVGCDLNGTWTIRATDLWAIDNGFIFNWSVEFASSVIPDCDDFVVE